MPTPSTFGELVNGIIGIINILVPALFGVVFVVVAWKIIDAWVINGSDQYKREEGRRLVGVAIIVFVLMIISWGIIAMIRATVFGS